MNTIHGELDKNKSARAGWLPLGKQKEVIILLTPIKIYLPFNSPTYMCFPTILSLTHKYFHIQYNILLYHFDDSIFIINPYLLLSPATTKLDPT